MLRKNHQLLLLVFGLLLSTIWPLQAQPQGDKHERIQAARVTFLTEKMQLTPDQAQKFWPVYNEFHKKRRDLKRQARVFKGQDLDKLTDAQLREGIKEMMESKTKEAELEKSYSDKFLTVISPKQLATMYRAEKEFMKMLIKRLDENKK